MGQNITLKDMDPINICPPGMLWWSGLGFAWPSPPAWRLDRKVLWSLLAQALVIWNLVETRNEKLGYSFETAVLIFSWTFQFWNTVID